MRKATVPFLGLLLLLTLPAFARAQEKPIADNKTEDGKARNRRLELVKQ